MMSWSDPQWVLLLMPNYITAACYFYIPKRLNSNTRLANEANRFLFVLFICSCGLHHAVHPTIMWLMAKYHWGWLYEPLISLEWSLAITSLIAGAKIDYGTR